MTKLIILLLALGYILTPEECKGQKYVLNNIDNIDTAQELINLSLRQKNSNLREAYKTIQKLIELAKKENNDSLLAEAEFHQGFYLFMMGENEEAKKVNLKNLNYFYPRDLIKAGKILNRLGKIELHLANYNQALDYINRAIKIFTEDYDNHSSAGFSYIYLTDLYTIKRDYTQAFHFANKALKLFTVNKDNDNIVMALGAIGDIYMSIEDYHQAKNYYLQAKPYEENIENKLYWVKLIYNLGVIESKFENFEKSKEYFDLALQNIEFLGDFFMVNDIYIDMGMIEKKLGNFERSHSLFNMALEKSKQFNNPRKINYSTLGISELYAAQKKWKISKKMIWPVYKWADQNKDIELISRSAAVIAQCSAADGEYSDAYKFQKIHSEARTAFINYENIEALTASRLRNEFQAQIEDQAITQKMEFDRQKQIRNLLILGMLGILFASGLLFRMNQIRKIANQKLEAKNEMLSKAEHNLEMKNEQLEEYIESNMQLENFAHLASHDLKEPLNNVVSFSKLLQSHVSEKISTKENQFLDFIVSGATNMQSTIKALLNFSIVSNQKLNIEQINPDDLLKDLKVDIHSKLVENMGQVHIHDMPEFIYGDPIMIKQAFQNLILNAIKFVPEGKNPIVNISYMDLPEAWQFIVKDNGIGMDPEFKERIFLLFKRLNSKEKFEGTGMGLAVVKKIIECHGGTIQVQTALGEGSSFIFTLPKNSLN